MKLVYTNLADVTTCEVAGITARFNPRIVSRGQGIICWDVFVPKMVSQNS